MTGSAALRKKALIQKLLREVRKQHPQEAGELAAFVRRFYAAVSPKDLVERDLYYLAGVPRTLWQFAGRRRPGEPLLRVFNPGPAEGFRSAHTVVQAVNDDRPFLVDSLTGELYRRGFSIHLVIHPIFQVERDSEGRRRGPVRQRGPGVPESWIHLEFDQQTSPEDLEELERALHGILRDVRRVVEAWPAMRERLHSVVTALGEEQPGTTAADRREARRLLHWLDQNHFIFLGQQEFERVEGSNGSRVRAVPGSALGLLAGYEDQPLTAEDTAGSGAEPLLVISKADRRSTVHRSIYMDYVGVRRFDREGRVVGGWSLVGLLTSSVYHESARTIPLVQAKVEGVRRRANLPRASHDAKALVHILETFPREELFQMTEEELYRTAMGILALQERQRVALFVRRDPFSRFASCLVYVPRDRYSTDLRNRMEEILEEELGGEVASFSTQVDDSPLARAHFLMRTPAGAYAEMDIEAIEARLADAARWWADRLREVLVATGGEEPALALLRQFGQAFPVSYREAFSAQEARVDLEEIRAAYQTRQLRARLYRRSGLLDGQVGFKLFHLGELPPLSKVLPMLENLGVQVVSEVPYPITPEHRDEPLWVRDLVLSTGNGESLALEDLKEIFEEAFHRLWRGEVENDSFNRLVLHARLHWRQVVVLRAYARYLRQVGLGFSQEYMAQTLEENSRVTGHLLALFETRFRPDDTGSPGTSLKTRKERSRKLLAEIRRALAEVRSADQDQILRRFRNLIEATLRTNHYQTETDGSPKRYLSFKLESEAILELQPPHPWREVFVYSPQVEGIHLRGGPVARGGIRWSDRPEDFRTEILGLFKAQMVKNAVIVPVGAKGGFVPKHLPASNRAAREAEARACYTLLIRGLLDLTDNRSGEAVLPPPRTVRWDGDDPYLVVAADKGTATFSDLANRTSAEYGFWLGDAFASGGTAGYDHKRMGITAKGAWESVKRHFREMDRDVDSEPFTVLGIGDMSGDVFGNGLLRSRQIRLVAAFNHEHIFVDPAPAPEASYRERERLFRLERSGWNDYDRAALSPGGGVYPRSARVITVSPQVQALAGLKKTSVEPAELIRALLKTEVDLLWFGGIGTFIKASTEHHGDTRDRQNDALRVDAREVRARVIAEGANLGLTQRARIEYAARGGRINTDFLDNSAGVDCSDHEVNIKLLLSEVMRQSPMTLVERNALLEAMTDEVERLVLRDNYLQTQAVSLALGSGDDLDRLAELMNALEREGRLDRGLEFLPSDRELLERRRRGRGLTRPELAVLLAYAKIHLYDQLLLSDLPEDPLLTHDLQLYFPAQLSTDYPEVITRHRLRREIIATHVTNSMVNRVGPGFVLRLAAQTGRSVPDIARAYTIVREAFDLRALWSAIEAQDGRIPAEVQHLLFREIGEIAIASTLWLLRRPGDALHISARVAELKPVVEELRQGLDELLPEAHQRLLERRADELVRSGAPEDLARAVAGLSFLRAALDIAGIAGGRGPAFSQVATTFFGVGARFDLAQLRQATEGLSAEGRWGAEAVAALIESFYRHQAELTQCVLREAAGRNLQGRALDDWIAGRESAVARLDRLLAEVRALRRPDMARLLVVDLELRRLAQG
jgi:glutamate dehydrogenase